MILSYHSLLNNHCS